MPIKVIQSHFISATQMPLISSYLCVSICTHTILTEHKQTHAWACAHPHTYPSTGRTEGPKKPTKMTTTLTSIQTLPSCHLQSIWQYCKPAKTNELLYCTFNQYANEVRVIVIYNELPENSGWVFLQSRVSRDQMRSSRKWSILRNVLAWDRNTHKACTEQIPHGRIKEILLSLLCGTRLKKNEKAELRSPLALI